MNGSAIGRVLVLGLLLPLTSGCSPDDSPGASEASSPEAVTPVQGSVLVKLEAPDDSSSYTTVLGQFFAGPIPVGILFDVDAAKGPCELLIPRVPFCNEDCGSSLCTDDDVCTPYPDPMSVGTLEITGLDSPLTIAEPPELASGYQSPTLPNPPCEAGAALGASSDRFEVEARCIPPLKLTVADPIEVKAGQPVALTWKQGPKSAASRIRIGLDLSHHGGQKGEIACEVPDTGAFEIPESLVSKLVALGLAGYPSLVVNRVSEGRQEDVVLTVSSRVERIVDTGVISCQADTDCPADQRCGSGLACE